MVYYHANKNIVGLYRIPRVGSLIQKHHFRAVREASRPRSWGSGPSPPRSPPPPPDCALRSSSVLTNRHASHCDPQPGHRPLARRAANRDPRRCARTRPRPTNTRGARATAPTARPAPTGQAHRRAPVTPRASATRRAPGTPRSPATWQAQARSRARRAAVAAVPMVQVAVGPAVPPAAALTLKRADHSHRASSPTGMANRDRKRRFSDGRAPSQVGGADRCPSREQLRRNGQPRPQAARLPMGR
jgi:hypothetical protein